MIGITTADESTMLNIQTWPQEQNQLDELLTIYHKTERNTMKVLTIYSD
jgi:hypothetical protein